LPRPLEPSKPFQPRILATLYRRGITKVIAIDDGSPHVAMTGIPFRLPKGGLLKTYPRMADTDEAIQVTNDLLANPKVLGQHRVNGFNPEPRVQAHFHHEATEDFYGQRQPGYRYNLITMKSRQLQSVPSLCQLSERCRKLCKVPQWNIGGTTVVLYRDGKDKMGQHKGTCVLLNASLNTN
jgi:2OG-Fe(II) oxygenase superfamily